ncbi:hypothetical protein HDU97_010283 [Phlyctochytrium planicorne]|nr:hypothetical protein HDU97_010283 [Phlyctochytrium planicorne]
MQIKTLFILGLAAFQATAAPAPPKPTNNIAADIATIQRSIAIIKNSDLRGVDPKKILKSLADVTEQVAVITDQTSILATAKEVISNSRIAQEIKAGLDKVEDAAARVGKRITNFIEASTGQKFLEGRNVAADENGEETFFDAEEHVELERRGGPNASNTLIASIPPKLQVPTATTTTAAAVATQTAKPESVGALKTVAKKLKQISAAIKNASNKVVKKVTTPKARETAGTVAEISEEIAKMSGALTSVLGVATLIPAVNGVAAPAVAITAAITAIAKSVDEIASGISKSDAGKIVDGVNDGAAAVSTIKPN